MDSIGVEDEAVLQETVIRSPGRIHLEKLKSPETVRKILFDSSEVSNSGDDEEVIESSQSSQEVERSRYVPL